MSDNLQNPIVSVVCTVYNHAAYLKDCLDGFVMQRTNFPFEVIVHDDCSTDNSQKIISEYARNYPDIIKPIFEKENQYSKHDGSLMRAIDCHVRGRYVAYCEGDDYWIDPDKLQRQVDIMEANPDYALCFHNVNIKCEDDRSFIIPLYAHLHEGFFTGDEIISKWTVPTCSAMMRTQDYLRRPYNRNFAVGDNVMWLNSLQYGKAYCIDEKMATYRRLGNGWTVDTFSKSKLQVAEAYKKQITHLELLKYYFPGIADKGINQSILEYTSRLTIIYTYNRKSESFTYFSKGLRTGGIKYIAQLLKTLRFYLKVRL